MTHSDVPLFSWLFRVPPRFSRIHSVFFQVAVVCIFLFLKYKW